MVIDKQLGGLNAVNLRRDALESAFENALGDLKAEMVDGHWVGELSASALSTATALSALGLYKHAPDKKSDESEPWMDEQLRGGLQWLQAQQNKDGGWGDTNHSHSNIATTLLALAAFKINAPLLAEMQAGTQFPEIQHNTFAFEGTLPSGGLTETVGRACAYVQSQGGVEGVRKRYGTDKTFAVPILANCAMSGLVAWAEVSALPFELASIPQRFYRFVRMPVVSYAVPALVAIGQCKYFADPPKNPVLRWLRRNAVSSSLAVLERMQPASGGYLEAIPLTCFVAMALIHSGRADHPVVHQAFRFVRDSYRDEGSWPIDTNLATWVTSLSINAIAPQSNTAIKSARPESVTQGDASATQDCAVFEDAADWLQRQVDWQWLAGCQHMERHPFTGADPGGWGWSDLSGAVPDADDTPGALLAFKARYDWLADCQSAESQQERREILKSAVAGCGWLLDLQNRDRGWPTFCRGWGRLPFDRSGADISAHALRALSAWRAILAKQESHQRLGSRIGAALRRGSEYLLSRQQQDGCWYPLWFGNQDHPDEENPIYGTAKVLVALVELLVEEKFAERDGTVGGKDLAARMKEAMERGASWLVSQQAAQGGWGGGDSLDWSNSIFADDRGKRDDISRKVGNSSVEETALAVESLLCIQQFRGLCGVKSGVAMDPSELSVNHNTLDDSIQLGLDWLVRAVSLGLHRRAWPIGFYFAKLWYHERLYPRIFVVAALGRALEKSW